MQFVFPERHRKFAREVGSVVLGVLIALGLGAVATEIGWRIEVTQARRALQAELGVALAVAKERATVAPCVDRRLDTLSDVIAEASRTRRLPPLGSISGPGRPNWGKEAWQSFNEAQTIAHFPSRERQTLSSLYHGLENARTWTAEDSAAWRTLAMMVGPGRVLDQGTESALYAALSTARYTNQLLKSTGEDLRATMKVGGLPGDYADVDLLPGRYPRRSICDAISTDIPPRYGQVASANKQVWRGADHVSREPAR